MRFDNFVNKILKEATFSTQPKESKTTPTTTPKDGLSTITGVTTKGTPVNQQQASQQNQVQPAQKPVENAPSENNASDEAIQGLANAIQQGNKQQEEFYKKMIATMTAQKAQTSVAPTQATTQTNAPTTTVPNAQQIISNLQKLGT